MPETPGVEFDTDMRLRCTCGWRGAVTDIDDWAVEEDLDHVARVCPDCGESVPEWGAFPAPDGVKRIAKGRIREALLDE